jgi:hypothetical protein
VQVLREQRSLAEKDPQEQYVSPPHFTNCTSQPAQGLTTPNMVLSVDGFDPHAKIAYTTDTYTEDFRIPRARTTGRLYSGLHRSQYIILHDPFMTAKFGDQKLIEGAPIKPRWLWLNHALFCGYVANVMVLVYCGILCYRAKLGRQYEATRGNS